MALQRHRNDPANQGLSKLGLSAEKGTATEMAPVDAAQQPPPQQYIPQSTPAPQEYPTPTPTPGQYSVAPTPPPQQWQQSPPPLQ